MGVCSKGVLAYKVLDTLMCAIVLPPGWIVPLHPHPLTCRGRGEGREERGEGREGEGRGEGRGEGGEGMGSKKKREGSREEGRGVEQRRVKGQRKI